MRQYTEKFCNYYEVMGVDPGADRETIRKAYFARLKEWHPDVNPDRKAEADEMTKTINLGYHILSDPERRKQYDRILRFTQGKDFASEINDKVFGEKLRKASPVLRQMLDSVRDLFSLFNDALKGKYKLNPVTLGMIGGGLLYFVLPADLVPDFIPFVGYLDDMAVLSAILKSMSQELAAHRNWRKA